MVLCVCRRERGAAPGAVACLGGAGGRNGVFTECIIPPENPGC